MFFKSKNIRKQMVAATGSLNPKSMKMFCDYQAFPESKIEENA